MSKIDKAIHEVYEYFNGTEVRWHDFHEVGGDEPYYDWYYAEDRLYVIRDRIFHRFEFIEAKSPMDTITIMNDTVKSVWGHEEDEID